MSSKPTSTRTKPKQTSQKKDATNPGILSPPALPRPPATSSDDHGEDGRFLSPPRPPPRLPPRRRRVGVPRCRGRTSSRVGAPLPLAPLVSSVIRSAGCFADRSLLLLVILDLARGTGSLGVSRSKVSDPAPIPTLPDAYMGCC